MNNFKKLLAMLLSLAMVLALFGCDSAGKDDGKKDNDTPTETTGEPEKEPVNAEDLPVAAKINDYEIGTVEFNYYFMDAVSSAYQQWYQTFGDMVNMYVLYSLNLDVSKPLNEQVRSDGTTWSAYFMDMALEMAKSNYAMCDQAAADGFELTQEQLDYIDANIVSLDQIAANYGFNTANEFLCGYFGDGSTVETYKEYLLKNALAQAYYETFLNSLEYTNTDLRAYEADKFNTYSSYKYATYYVGYQSFLPNEKDEEGNVIAPTQDQIAAAKDNAQAAANALTKATDLDSFNAAIAEVENTYQISGTPASETLTFYDNLPNDYKEWFASNDRVDNEISIFPDTESTLDESGNAIESVNGYNVIIYLGRNDNNYKSANVRHLLVKFLSADGSGVYTAEDKAATLAIAEGYLETWKSGEATEESFIALVQEYSEDTGSIETGGLYENITWETNFVPEFLDWSLAEGREAGNYGIIETIHGYHIMFYSGSSERTYRDALIYEDLVSADLETWYNGIVGPFTAEYVDTTYVNAGLVIAAS